MSCRTFNSIVVLILGLVSVFCSGRAEGRMCYSCDSSLISEFKECLSADKKFAGKVCPRNEDVCFKTEEMHGGARVVLRGCRQYEENGCKDVGNKNKLCVCGTDNCNFAKSLRGWGFFVIAVGLFVLTLNC